MSVASSAANSKPGNDGMYITPGDYLLQATGHKENVEKVAFIAEHDVLRSKAVRDPHPEDKDVLPPGMSGTLYVDCGKFDGSLAWQVPAYFSALVKQPVEEIDEESMEVAMSDAQPFVGYLIRCKAYTHITKNDVRITKTKFLPATDEDKAEAAQLRADAGLSPLEVGEI
jgi:hypothetical protein